MNRSLPDIILVQCHFTQTSNGKTILINILSTQNIYSL